MKQRPPPAAFGLMLLILALPLRAEEITVFAAASLTDSLKEIAAAYEKTSGDRIVFNFGASSMLARQIDEGAPADIFFSADEAKMDDLAKHDRIVPSTRRSRLSNSLAIVVPADSGLTIASACDLTNAAIKRIALADPQTVPAGIYSRIYLARLKLWPLVESKIVPTDNVRAALAAVESGNVDVGMVYRTDAAISKRIKVACEIPRAEGPDISYPVALVKDSKETETARKFLHYLDSEEAAKVFGKYGFIVRP